MDIRALEEARPSRSIPQFAVGDTVRVSHKIVEGDRERTQVIEGVVIRVRRAGAGASLTLRHVFQGIGVERTFPLYSPRVENIEVVRHGKVRRAKLYYLRQAKGKAARVKEKRIQETDQGEVR